MSIQALREKHNTLVNEANHILSEKGDRVWTQEDQQKFDNAMDEAELCKKQIDAHQRKIDLDAEENFKDIDNFRKDEKQELSNAQKGLDIFLRKSFREMSNDDAVMFRNAMSTTTGSEGGYTVQTEIAETLIEALKEYGFMRKEASQITTAKGNDLSYPTSDGTSEEGEWVAQNIAASAADIDFGTLALNVHKLSSKVITIPIELLQDSIIDIQALVFSRMVSRMGRTANKGYTTGTGTAQPKGLVTAASVGKTGPTGQTVTITYDDLVDMVDSLDIAYLENGGSLPCWMFNQTMRRTLRKIKDTTGRPIWTPSYDTGLSGTRTDMLLDYPVCMNNDMASPAANAKSLAFGRVDKYMIRDALDVSLFRFDDSAYVTKGQVGFLGWARTGGNLMDVNAVKLYQHSAT
jgi:HK97 family phage major capsid protein